jgi:hypothetical protein
VALSRYSSGFLYLNKTFKIFKIYLKYPNCIDNIQTVFKIFIKHSKRLEYIQIIQNIFKILKKSNFLVCGHSTHVSKALNSREIISTVVSIHWPALEDRLIFSSY